MAFAVEPLKGGCQRVCEGKEGRRVANEIDRRQRASVKQREKAVSVKLGLLPFRTQLRGGSTERRNWLSLARTAPFSPSVPMSGIWIDADLALM